MKDHLKKRLRYLWTFELLNALVVFPFLYYELGLIYRLGWFSLASLLVVCAILFVGTAFWLCKSRTLSGSTFLYQPPTRQAFKISKYLFAILLLVLLVLFAVRAFFQQDASLAELIVGGAFTLMALLEYINYYFIQLMYDNGEDLRYLLLHRRLKPAVMVRELDI